MLRYTLPILVFLLAGCGGGSSPSPSGPNFPVPGTQLYTLTYQVLNSVKTSGLTCPPVILANATAQYIESQGWQNLVTLSSAQVKQVLESQGCH